MKSKIFYIIFIMFFAINLFSVSISTELGFGSFVNLNFGYKLFGLGVGYLTYNDSENNVDLKVITPFFILSKEVANIFIIRGKVGLDYVSENGNDFSNKSYLFSPEFMVKIFKFTKSYFYVGVGVPATIGKDGVSIVSVIGTGFSFIF